MTRIDFYVLATARPQERERVACRLVEKARQHDQTVYIHVESSAQAAALDELLWTFRQQSFIPHARAGADADAPVLIGCGDDMPPAGRALLINLDADVPLFFSGFERVMEIIDGDDQRRAQGRSRFRFYQDRGYPLQTHKL
ncbi:MAG TPA: DNA polymerase III subunit chi [Gammaproteobacteria bacterium]|nr:DNA polymerase III subunit chi [Gammaproteobacteria bacterium]